MKDVTKAKSRRKERKKIGLWTTTNIKIETENPIINTPNTIKIAIFGIGLQLFLFSSLATAFERFFLSLCFDNPCFNFDSNNHLLLTTDPTLPTLITSSTENANLSDPERSSPSSASSSARNSHSRLLCVISVPSD